MQWGREGGEVRVVTEHLQLRFAPASPESVGGVVSVLLQDPASGARAQPGQEPGEQLWALEFSTPPFAPADTVELTPRAATDAEVQVHPGTSDDTVAVSLLWTGLRLPDGSAVHVSVEVRVSADSPLTRWTLKVRHDSKRFGVWRITFPVVSVSMTPDVSTVYVPWNMGVGLAAEGGPRRFPYPSCTAAMQFMCAVGGDTGLYLGAHDPACGHKELFFSAAADGRPGKALVLGITHLPAGMGLPGTQASLPFESVVGFYPGGWYEGSQIYRAWTERRHGEEPARTPRNSWMRDVDVWFRWRMEGDAMARKADEMQRRLGVPIAVHWYTWHAIAHDVGYPEYFPPRKGFAEHVMEAQAKGVRVMPYINARLWDPNTESWRAEHAERFCAKAPDGMPQVEVYGSKVPLVPMCPLTDFWQQRVLDIVERLVKDYGVDGVYLDQIGAAYPVVCFDSSHGHPPGGGDFWVRGYREMLAKIRARLADTVLTTEENADPFLDLFDGLLVVNGPADHETQGLVPMFPAVYSAVSCVFGIQYVSEFDVQEGVPLRLKLARQLCWGAQLGWFGLDLELGRPEGLYLRRLARARHRLHRWLVDGDMRKPPAVDVGAVTVPTLEPGGERARGVNVPAVVSATWSDGRTALVLFTNFDREPRTFEAVVDLGWLLPKGREDCTWRGLVGPRLERGRVKNGMLAVGGRLAGLTVAAAVVRPEAPLR